MTREMLIEELKKQGYEVLPWDVTKNGTKLEGIRIRNGHVAEPIIYTEKLLADANARGISLQEAAAEVIKIYEKNTGFDFDTDQLSDRDYVAHHLFIGLQRTSQEAIVKRPCEELAGLECYLFLRGQREGGAYSIRLTSDTLALSGISEEEAWSQAFLNVEAETVIENLRKVICEITNTFYQEGKKRVTSLYIISNRTRTYGASAILNKKALAAFAAEMGVSKFIILPSSVHEMLLLPCSGEVRLPYYSNVVRDVNRCEVAPEERLTNRAYIIEV